jgi:hypothetical protein
MSFVAFAFTSKTENRLYKLKLETLVCSVAFRVNFARFIRRGKRLHLERSALIDKNRFPNEANFLPSSRRGLKSKKEKGKQLSSKNRRCNSVLDYP